MASNTIQDVDTIGADELTASRIGFIEIEVVPPRALFIMLARDERESLKASCGKFLHVVLPDCAASRRFVVLVTICRGIRETERCFEENLYIG